MTDTAPTPVAPATTKFLQGRAVVRDVLLDPDRPEKPLGDEARANAIRKGDKNAVFLVHFDLHGLALPRWAEVTKATVSFYVWDPSSRGNTKVCALCRQNAMGGVQRDLAATGP